MSEKQPEIGPLTIETPIYVARGVYWKDRECTWQFYDQKTASEIFRQQQERAESEKRAAEKAPEQRLQRLANFKQFSLRLFKVLLAFGATFCFLRYLVDFSMRQSVWLAAMVLVFYLMLAPREHKPRFAPYKAFIRPKLCEILTDFQLVKDKEEWGKLRTKIDELPKEPWNIWNSGFFVSFITPELIYKDAWNSFSTEVQLYASLEPVTIQRDGNRMRLTFMPAYSPSLELKLGNYGYRLTLTLLDWYWEEIRHAAALKQIEERRVSRDPMSGTVEVELSTIPYEEFGVHFAILPSDSGQQYRRAVKDRATARARFGWTANPQSDMYGIVTDAERSNTVEHKYVSVSHSAL